MREMMLYLEKKQTTPCDSNITGDADCSGRIIVARGVFVEKVMGQYGRNHHGAEV